MVFRPETAEPLNELADILLRGPNTLLPGERELIAAFVSSRNDCFFCQTVHGAVAAHHFGNNEQLVLDVKRDEEITYSLVTTEEADAANGRVSTTSPIGRALLGKQEGDSVRVQSPGGVKELEILKLTTIHDAIENV